MSQNVSTRKITKTHLVPFEEWFNQFSEEKGLSTLVLEFEEKRN